MNAAVIVDTRLEHLERAFDKHLEFLPNLDIVVFTYPEVFSKLRKPKGFSVIFHEVEEREFYVHNYNIMLTSKDFWKKLNAYNRVLIFQSDSELLTHGINEFFKYDYIGAPWPDYNRSVRVGNGGLSVRNPKVMLKVLENHEWNKDCGEDIFFADLINTHNYGMLAPLQEAFRFSVESIFTLGSIGAHDIERYLTSAECKQIRTQYDYLH